MGEGKEGIKTGRVATDSNSEVATGAKEPSIKGGSTIKVGGRLPCALAGVVEPLNTEFKAAGGGQAFGDNAVYGVFGRSTSGEGPRVVRGVGRGVALGTEGAHAASKGQADMDAGRLTAKARADREAG